MPGGRPTKYNDELVAKAWEYIDNYSKHGDLIPSVAGLCFVLKISKSTVYDWAQDPDKEFSDILAQLNVNQEKTLLNGGLSGEMNSNIVKLALGKQGYHEKQDIEHTGKDGGAIELTETERSARIAALLDSARSRRDGEANNE